MQNEALKKSFVENNKLTKTTTYSQSKCWLYVAGLGSQFQPFIGIPDN